MVYKIFIASNTSLIINNTNITHMVNEICLQCPLSTFSNTYDNMPNTIPWAILKVNGIITMVRKAGSASVKLSKLISTTDEIMNKPTRINAGAVAEAGTIRKRGARNRERTNIVAVERAVKPVRPPTATPEALSTYEVTVLVPRMAPKVVPSASANSALLICGKLPSLSVNPILRLHPITYQSYRTNSQTGR